MPSGTAPMYATPAMSASAMPLSGEPLHRELPVRPPRCPPGAASSSAATIALALATTLSVALATASPPVASDREPYVSRPSGPMAVSPWMISMTDGSTPSLSATICAIAVSRPWPWGDVPV